MKDHIGIASLLFICSLPLAHSLPLGGVGPGAGLGNTVINPVLRNVNKALEGNMPGPLALKVVSQTLQRQTEQVFESLNSLPDRLPIKNLLGQVLFHEVVIAPGVRIVEHEWLVWVADSSLPGLQQADIQVLESKQLKSLKLSYVRLRTNQTNDNRNYIQALFPVDAVIKIQRNFIFATQTAAADPVESPSSQSNTTQCQRPVRLGMIDTALNTDHPSLQLAYISRQSFVDETLTEPLGHGTSVAGLLVANSADYRGAAPQAQLFAASVFYQRDAYSQGATSDSLLQALDWLLGQQVVVINMSLAGPADPLLAFALQQINTTATIVVAAVGNAGPASPPLYPAAYASTIAVTAVDNSQLIYRWAVHGEHVDIAAAGVNVKVARAAGGYSFESGTSLSAPLVTGFIGCHLSEKKDITGIREWLAEQAIDLGQPGKDPVYGLGVLLAP